MAPGRRAAGSSERFLELRIKQSNSVSGEAPSRAKKSRRLESPAVPSELRAFCKVELRSIASSKDYKRGASNPVGGKAHDSSKATS